MRLQKVGESKGKEACHETHAITAVCLLFVLHLQHGLCVLWPADFTEVTIHPVLWPKKQFYITFWLREKAKMKRIVCHFIRYVEIDVVQTAIIPF